MPRLRSRGFSLRCFVVPDRLKPRSLRRNVLSLLISCPDTPLVSFGTGDPGPVKLCEGNSAALNRGEIRSRIMNNFWETNFAVDLGGWHEFRYILTEEKPGRPADEQMQRCAALSTGPAVIEL